MKKISSVIIEVRAAEGGSHAKRLVNKMVDIYKNLAARRSL